MGTRRKARVTAVQAMYAWVETGAELNDLCKFDWLETPLDEEAHNFAVLLLTGTVENCGIIDNAIEKHLDNWRFDRLTHIDLAILRISAYALIFQRDIPARVTIDEAVEIAKIFGSDDSWRFVNGVLDAVSHDDSNNLI